MILKKIFDGKNFFKKFDAENMNRKSVLNKTC